jgi:hypothetical protein
MNVATWRDIGNSALINQLHGKRFGVVSWTRRQFDITGHILKFSDDQTDTGCRFVRTSLRLHRASSGPTVGQASRRDPEPPMCR